VTSANLAGITSVVKVATWNVNSVKARLERVQSFLHRERPDILCLQELKCVDEAFPYEAFRTLGYEATVHGQKTYNGVAILSREAPSEVARGFQDSADDPAARYVVARFGEISVASVYVPNGQSVGSEKYQYKLEWLSRFKRRLEQGLPPRMIICGDFNIAPDERDVYDPKAWEGQVLFSEPEKSALEKLLSLGLVDTFRQHHSEPGLYTWWDYRQLGFPKNRGLRIDFILATPLLSRDCRESRIDREERKGTGASDHAPVISVFS